MRKARSPLDQFRRASYFTGRALGDVQAAQRGRLARRVVRRTLVRSLLRGLR